MHLEKLISFRGRPGPLLLVVADGVGLADPGPANAISLADTPNIDALVASPLSTSLRAHGTHVGLPTDDDMGNSEVGHNTLGGGRIFDQGAKLVNSAFDSGSIFESESWQEVEARGKAGGTVHFLGLLSDGNVHSHINHLLALVDRTRSSGISRVRIHVLLDGRDVAPRSALEYVAQLEDHITAINREDDLDYRIASGGGRMVVTMDRYEADWEMVRLGYHIHILADTSTGGSRVKSAADEIQRQYDNNAELSDQYLEPFVLVDDSGDAVGAVADGDSVVLFNFRGDRAIEICQALENQDFTAFDRPALPDLYFCGMLQYDGDLAIPKQFLVNPPAIDRTMVEFLCGEKLPTFAVSETQKFGHVTYFWNGNRSGYIDESLETYIEIPSDNCEFNEAPEMKAVEITDATIQLMETGKYRFGRINFANGDMVGHTGDIGATAKSLECVDRCMGRLVDWIDRNEGILIFTADHGNADEMFVEKSGERIERTSHSLNPVPLVIHDSGFAGEYELNREIDGGLANVAATVFNLMGYRAPDDYEPSLVHLHAEPNRRSIFRGRVVNLGIETTTLPNGEMLAMEIVRHPGGAVVVAVDSDGMVCLIRQFRHAAGGWIWELPAGILDPNESPLETARRELQEETGTSGTNWEYLGPMLSTPGFCDEVLHLYLTTELDKGTSTPEPHEFIEVHWIPLEQAFSMLLAGEITDAKSVIGLFRAREQLTPGSD